MGSNPPVDQWKKGKVDIVLTKKTPTMAIEMKDGRILAIFPCSDLLSYLYTGDFIESVNGQKVLTTPELTAAILAKVPGKITIEYRRDEHCTFNMKPLPPQRSGFDMFVNLDLEDFSGQVVIAMIESGSTASKVILLKVNNTPVVDRDSARKMIMQSINSSKKVTMTLERQTLVITAATSIMAPPPPDPKTPVAPQPIVPSVDQSCKVVATPSVNKTIDVLLPEDVLAIMEKNKDFWKAEPPSGPAIKKIKQQPGVLRAELVQERHEEIAIPYDPSPKQLKFTPKRVGS